MEKGNHIPVTKTTTTIVLALAAVLTMSVLNNSSLFTTIPAFGCMDHHDGKDRDGCKDHHDGNSDHDGKDRDGKYHKSRGSHQIPTVVTIPLEGLSLNEGQFLLLSDTTPVRVGAAHLAINVPCTDEGVTDIVAVAGVAPDLDIFELELVSELSAPPTNCLYHLDIPSNEIEVTDIAIANTGADIQFGSGNFATLSITEVDEFNSDNMMADINP